MLNLEPPSPTPATPFDSLWSLFCWRAPWRWDLYDAICEYLEVDTRLETLNARFEVLQATLDVLRDHQNNEHSSRLEWVVIVLIFIELVIGIVEIGGVMGWIGKENVMGGGGAGS